MAGLHECRYCHYRFEDGQALEEHDIGGCPEMDEEDTSYHCEDCGEMVDSEKDRFDHEQRCIGDELDEAEELEDE